MQDSRGTYTCIAISLLPRSGVEQTGNSKKILSATWPIQVTLGMVKREDDGIFYYHLWLVGILKGGSSDG